MLFILQQHVAHVDSVFDVCSKYSHFLKAVLQESSKNILKKAVLLFKLLCFEDSYHFKDFFSPQVHVHV